VRLNARGWSLFQAADAIMQASGKRRQFGSEQNTIFLESTPTEHEIPDSKDLSPVYS